MEQLRETFLSAAAKLECEIIEMDGEPDPVHLLVAYSPKLAVSVMVNNLKSVSSRLLRQQKYTVTNAEQNRAAVVEIILCL